MNNEKNNLDSSSVTTNSTSKTSTTYPLLFK